MPLNAVNLVTMVLDLVELWPVSSSIESLRCAQWPHRLHDRREGILIIRKMYASTHIYSP